MANDALFIEHKTAAISTVQGLVSKMDNQLAGQKVAKTAFETEQGITSSLRVQCWLDAAHDAFTAKMDDSAVEDAVKAVIAQGNNGKGYKEKTHATLRTFMSQLKLAMHSQVRERLPSIELFAREAWMEEQTILIAAKGDAPSPLRDLWHGQVQMVAALMVLVKDGHGNVTFPSKESIVEYAVENDPAKDSDKVARKLARYVADGLEILKEFPDADLKLGLDLIGKIDAKALLVARTLMLAAQEKALDDAAKSAPMPPPSNLRDANGAEKAPEVAPSDIGIADLNAQIA